MSDISITAASVVFSAAALLQRRRGIAGAAITVGQIVYIDTSDSNKIKLADANGATALIRTAVGMACSGAAAAGQAVEFVEFDDDLTLGTHGVSTNGAIVLSATAGALAPIADITTGWYGSILAIAKSSTKVVFDARNPLNSGVAS